jgi:predicted TIM-barrel fold metal-dependent hydrolase
MTGPVVDSAIHNAVPGIEALLPYLSVHWREYVSQSAFKGPADTSWPPGAPTSFRSRPSAGEDVPGTTLADVRREVLDANGGVEAAILCCAYAADSIHNPDLAAAMSAAVNDWQSEHWLEPEPRLRASIVVPVQQPAMAAAEIDRVVGRGGFVQVVLPVNSAMPYGNRNYLPIFEAAARHDLAVAMQFGGAPGNPPTGTGWPSFYLEEYVGMAQVFQSQILSLIVEGVFDRFPSLRMVCVEGGFAWVPSLMWRLDKEWKGLRREVPWTTRLPSEYIRERMRFTTTPIDAPPTRSELLELVEQMESNELLLYAGDYPHSSDEGPESVVAALPERLQAAVRYENARRFYGLG